MRTAESFRALYRPHPRGWTAAVTEVPEVAAYGGTLESARIDLVDQLSRHLGVYPGSIAVDDSVELSPSTEAALTAARAARNAALQAAAASQAATATAVVELTAAGLSLRDCGYLLGISHGRVRQILDASRATRRKPASARRVKAKTRTKTTTKTGART